MSAGELVSSAGLLLLILASRTVDFFLAWHDRKKNARTEEKKAYLQKESDNVQKKQLDLLSEIIIKMNSINPSPMNIWEKLGFTEQEWLALPEGEKQAIANGGDWKVVPSKGGTPILVMASAPEGQPSLRDYQEAQP